MTKKTPSMLEMVNNYVEHKRGLGYKLGTESYMLRSFARHADRQAPGQPLTTQLALEWATAPESDGRTYHAKRLDALRSFARYLAAFQPGTEIPPGGILGPSLSRVEPHIYTREEVAALMREAMNVKPSTPAARTNSIRNATVIGLLACTGMRIGEVLALKNEDVDLATGVITVRESKKLPMRLVPITDCAVRQLRRYQQERDRRFGSPSPSGAFIQSSWNGRLTYGSFFAAFKIIRERAGVKRSNVPNRPPRLHDLRHTFACNHLLRAYREGRDIDNAVHELAVYLGHATLKST
ncbi:MAG TPA: tyrosine-type recombinase/integrase, partial [Candidatus Hydrogenedentes bacterium]|nr:tyrosine-type recombinase/integrase [Candidatus Hydrogenedentota bacterium]